jgi:hypothetical protein
MLSVFAILTSAASAAYQYSVRMRATPTMSFWNNGVQNQLRNSSTGAVVSMTSPVASLNNSRGFAFLNMTNSPLTVNSTYDFDVIADARL